MTDEPQVLDASRAGQGHGRVFYTAQVLQPVEELWESRGEVFVEHAPWLPQIGVQFIPSLIIQADFNLDSACE